MPGAAAGGGTRRQPLAARPLASGERSGAPTGLAGEVARLQTLLHREQHIAAALRDRVAEMARELRALRERAPAPAPAPAVLSLEPDGGGEARGGAEAPASPSVLASPTTPADAASDSPRHRADELSLEVLRSRTGRARSMFVDLASPAASTFPPAESRPDADSLVEIVVPEFAEEHAGPRLVVVHLPDGGDVEAEIPPDVPSGACWQFDVRRPSLFRGFSCRCGSFLGVWAQVVIAAQKQRRRLFLQDDATRQELLDEIAELSWALHASQAATIIQKTVHRRRHAQALARQGAAMRAVLRPA